MAVTTHSDASEQASQPRASVEPHRIGGGFLDPKMLWKSLPDAVKKLDPRVMVKNPVMFVVEIGSVLTTWQAIAHPSVFAWVITLWLWLTVVFANLAEAVAEGRGKAQAATLRKAKTTSTARKLASWSPGDAGAESEVPGTELRPGDLVVAGPPSRLHSGAMPRFLQDRALLLMGAFGFVAGLPLPLSGFTLRQWLSEGGTSLEAIG
ncbi:MAG: hypothetical protein ACJ786_29120, partial [Catenulispora sp.]